MSLVECPDCKKQISNKAPACPHCGRPSITPAKAGHSVPAPQGGTFCKRCNKWVTPAVVSVGGGTCTVGSRETWRCPSCRSVLFRRGCFVATATYGDEDLAEVKFLRAFRDEILLTNHLGRAFVWAYYRLSPYLALFVEKVPLLRKVFRAALDWVVLRIEISTHLNREQFRDKSSYRSN
jgi:hypothetical protein